MKQFCVNVHATHFLLFII